MKSIITKNKNGEIYGLVVRPEEGELLCSEQLERLLPYILHVVKGKTPAALYEKIEKKLTVSDKFLIFQNLSDIGAENVSSLLDIVISACDSEIKEVLIVPQDMGNGPNIRHRIMHFGKNEENRVSIKYTQLGSFNHFNVAMETLASWYPSVEEEKYSILSGSMKI